MTTLNQPAGLAVPPPYPRPVVKFAPTIPTLNTRYNKRFLRPNSTQAGIPAGTRPKTFSGHKAVLPVPWREFVTPEGDTYYAFYQGQEVQMVTAEDPREDALRDILQGALDRLIKQDQSVRVCEVFVSIRRPSAPVTGPQEVPLVEYYVIDHVARLPFWVHDVSSKHVGLENFETTAYLKSALLAEYFTHLDYFPAHRHIERHLEIEIMSILRLGAIDDMTAPGSTCPYSAEECQAYLRILQPFDDDNTYSAYRTSAFARIWGSIARVRHINRYGLDGPRLDRLQGVPDFLKAQTRPSLWYGLGETLILNMSRSTFLRLTRLWNGRVVYHRHWNAFFRDVKETWLRNVGLGMAIIIADVMLSDPKEVSLLLASSMAFAGCAVCSGLLLYQKHSNGRVATAPEISMYIATAEHPTHGLRGLAISYSVPSASALFAGAGLAFHLMTRTFAAAKDGASSDFAAMIVVVWMLPGLILLILFTNYGWG